MTTNCTVTRVTRCDFCGMVWEPTSYQGGPWFMSSDKARHLCRACHRDLINCPADVLPLPDGLVPVVSDPIEEADK